MALQIVIKVSPSSGRQVCTLDKNGTLKCFLKSAPEHGKANAELITLLSKRLDLGKDDISILLGTTARTKTIKLDTALTQEEVIDRLCDHRQTKFV